MGFDLLAVLGLLQDRHNAHHVLRNFLTGFAMLLFRIYQQIILHFQVSVEIGVRTRVFDQLERVGHIEKLLLIFSNNFYGGLRCCILDPYEL